MWPPDRIIRLRKTFGQNQRDFADRIGVSIDTLQNWEQGRVTAPDIAGRLFDLLLQQVSERQPA